MVSRFKFSLQRRLLFGVGFGLLGTQLQGCKPLKQNWTTQQAILDTILPEDEFPGALDLGYDAKLTEWTKINKRYITRFDSLFAYVEQFAKSNYSKPFNALDADQREELLFRMSQDSEIQTPRHMLSMLRHLILGWYYSSESGHDSLNYLPPYRYPSYPG